MPDTAIATGVADRVLSADEMGLVISEFLAGGLPEINEFDNPQGLQKVCDLLLQKTGHDFSNYKKSTVARRVERRVQANGLTTLQAYLEFLDSDVLESQLLLKDLLISVTQFFRDPDAFTALEERVIPDLFKSANPSDGIRVWVPACATGEEAYTLAILLLDQQRILNQKLPIQIFATDIDRAALDFARVGVYPLKIAENIKPEFLDRYFVREESAYRTKLELRETCIFSEHSLLKNPPFSRLGLISCRNLFIYWEAELQNRIFPVFHYALKSNAYLFLGPAESVTGASELFTTLEKKYRIYQRNEVANLAHVYFPTAHPALRSNSRQSFSEPVKFGSDRDLNKTIFSALLDDYAPPAFVITDRGEIVFYSGKTGKFLEPPTGAPSNLIFDLIRKSIRAELQALVHRSIKEKAEVSHPSVTFENEGAIHRVRLVVRPMRDPILDRELFLVIFVELMEPKSSADAKRDGIAVTPTDAIVKQLQSELRDTREHLQSTVEQVKSSNEELLSMNEELQSANEELQTSKEELQSTNEELETVNSELNKKVDELDNSNGDLQNFFASAQIPIIFLDRNFRIQRFTPAATQIFRLIKSDIGRGISDITSGIENEHFAGDFSKVLDTLQPVEREVISRDGKSRFIMRVKPYRTVANMIDGVIATFSDVTDLSEAQSAIMHSHAQIVDVLESIERCLFLN